MAHSDPIVARVAARFIGAGADTFTEFVRNPDPKAAFQEAVDDARYESGHGGYSGTIAEKSHYIVRTREPLTMEQARKYIDNDIHQNDKWGPAFAIPVVETSRGGEKALKIRVEAMNKMDAYKAALKKIEAEHPKAVADVNYNTGVVEVKGTTGLTLTPEKVSESFFEIKTPGIAYRLFKDSYASRAEAISAIKDLAKTSRDLRAGQVFIVQGVKQTDKITVGAPKNMPVWEVSGKLIEQQATGKIVGWLFYGLASS